MQEREDLSEQLHRALAECARLREENARLKALLYSQTDQTSPAPEIVLPTSTIITPEIISANFTPEAKVALFRSLFRGREDVYALRWEGKNGRSGYSPACVREWEQNADGKFKLKQERNREYFVSLRQGGVKKWKNCALGLASDQRLA
jgi:hypothetical protein